MIAVRISHLNLIQKGVGVLSSEGEQRGRGTMRNLIRYVLIIIVIGIVCFGLAQLIPVPHTNPPVVTQVKWDSARTQQLFMRACGDCHSNQTTWPWYSYVAPVSWLVSRDVIEGRDRLNISELNSGRGERGFSEMGRVVERGSMPPIQYLILHPNASLSSTEKQDLINGLNTTFSSSAPVLP